MTKKSKAPLSKFINISGDGNIVGNNNVSNFQTNDQAKNLSSQEILSLLELVLKLLHESNEKSVVTQKIESEVEFVKEMIEKPVPEQKQTIINKLKQVEELVKTGLGLSTLSLQLMPTMEKLIHMAKTVFG